MNPLEYDISIRELAEFVARRVTFPPRILAAVPMRRSGSPSCACEVDELGIGSLCPGTPN